MRVYPQIQMVMAYRLPARWQQWKLIFALEKRRDRLNLDRPREISIVR